MKVAYFLVYWAKVWSLRFSIRRNRHRASIVRTINFEISAIDIVFFNRCWFRFPKSEKFWGVEHRWSQKEEIQKRHWLNAKKTEKVNSNWQVHCPRIAKNTCPTWTRELRSKFLLKIIKLIWFNQRFHLKIEFKNSSPTSFKRLHSTFYTRESLKSTLYTNAPLGRNLLIFA